MASPPTLADDARAFFAHEDLPELLAWAALLSPLHVRLFAVELNAALASPTPDPVSLAALLDAWKATAELDASPDLRQIVAENRRGAFESADAWLSERRTA